MTELLVSVRSVEEAESALSGGADIIDVKEPQRGALGRADAPTLRGIRQVIEQRAPLSAALGEITDPPDALFFTALAGYRFAKIGLAGALDVPDWESSWRKLVEQLPHETSPVSVIYADWQRCGAPSPAAVLAAARELRCPIALVDTFFKDGRNLLAALPLHELRQLVDRVHSEEMRIVLAGGIDASSLSDVARLRPDLVGVRGAVCTGPRESRLEERLVRELAQRLHM